MSEPYEPPLETAADDVTVGAWLDLDDASESQPGGADPIIEPVAQKPGLWARLMRASGRSA